MVAPLQPDSTDEVDHGGVVPLDGERAGSGAWTEPGAFPVAPGVHRIPLPLPGDGLKAVNVYAIEDGDRIAIIDAGWHRTDSWEALRGGLRVIGAEPGDVRNVLVTHVHHDHYGQAAAIRRAGGGTVVLGEGERIAFDTFETPEGRVRADRWGHDALVRIGASPLADEMQALMGEIDPDRKRGHAEWERPDRWLEDGQTVELRTRTLEVIGCPGHTRGHVGFFDADAEVFFTGDHVLPHITPSIGVEIFNDDRGLVEFIASLAKVRQLPARRVLPAHGPDFEGLAQRVDELLDHHATRLSDCIAAVRVRARSPYDVAHDLRWTRRQRHFDDLDFFNRMLAAHETAAHLELLAIQGTLTRAVDEDGVVRFGMPEEGRGGAIRR
jgi:glyoxylase-like metal-dependent hydrolase (beta-lactamase superfamily II)